MLIFICSKFHIKNVCSVLKLYDVSYIPDITNRWSMTSMSNRWVISWLVIDYWRWSMSNRWVIEAQKFCGPSITHRLLYCARKTLFLFFCTIFFSFVILLSVLDAFFLVSEDPVDDVETQSANHKYRWFSIVQYFTLPNSLINNKTAEQ